MNPPRNQEPGSSPSEWGSCDLSVVVPAYNEAQSLEHFLHTLMQSVLETKARFEVIVVDDGSTDQTFEIILRGSKNDARLKGLKLSRNFGKDAAIVAGLNAARGRANVVLDADGEHPPSLIPKMMELWRSGRCEVVSATRRSCTAGRWRRFESIVFTAIFTAVTGLRMRHQTDFKLIDRRVVEQVVRLREATRFFRGTIAWLGFRQAEIPFDAPARAHGQSRWSFASRLVLGVSAVLEFSSAPLVWSVYCVVAGLCLSLLGVGSRLGLAAASPSEPSSMVVNVSVLVGGVVMTGLGLLGMYVVRIFQRLQDRPAYIVDRTVGFLRSLRDPSQRSASRTSTTPEAQERHAAHESRTANL